MFHAKRLFCHSRQKSELTCKSFYRGAAKLFKVIYKEKGAPLCETEI